MTDRITYAAGEGNLQVRLGPRRSGRAWYFLIAGSLMLALVLAVGVTILGDYFTGRIPGAH